MEYAYDDWCIAQVAELLGKEKEQQYYYDRSQNYLNLYDQESRFFRAKSIEGKWKEPFDPIAYHPEDYCEANAWQYYWYVPQNLQKLIELTGGDSAFNQKLDKLFQLEQISEENPEWISGNIGQYVHGNEPSHHVPYLYQFVGQAHKTQKRVRQIMDELYTTNPNGLAGNEDCGQMSAWYIFSALGFYPVNPANGQYVFGSPEISSATIHLPEGKIFRIEVKNQSNENVYVKSISLNGKKLNKTFLSHHEILSGGKLEFEMTDSF